MTRGSESDLAATAVKAGRTGVIVCGKLVAARELLCVVVTVDNRETDGVVFGGGGVAFGIAMALVAAVCV